MKNHNLDKECFAREIRKLQETEKISEELHIMIRQLSRIVKAKDKYRGYPEDWVSSAYTKVIEVLTDNPHRLDPDKNCYGYIYKIISFFYIDSIKRLKRENKYREELTEEFCDTGTNESIKGVLIAEDNPTDVIREEDVLEMIAKGEI